jgi:hypothetical protein
MNKGLYKLEQDEKTKKYVVLNPDGSTYFSCNELTGYQTSVVEALIGELNRLWKIVNKDME